MGSFARGGSSPPSRTSSRPALGTARRSRDAGRRHLAYRWRALTAAAALAVGLALTVGACGGWITPAGPAEVTRQALDAAQAGDRAGLLETLTPRSRALLDAIWSAADETGHGALFTLQGGAPQVASVRPFPPGEEGVERARVVVTDGPDRLALVLHRRAGAWRIDLVDTERTLTGLGGAF